MRFDISVSISFKNSLGFLGFERSLPYAAITSSIHCSSFESGSFLQTLIFCSGFDQTSEPCENPSLDICPIRRYLCIPPLIRQMVVNSGGIIQQLRHEIHHPGSQMVVNKGGRRNTTRGIQGYPLIAGAPVASSGPSIRFRRAF